MLKIKNVVLWFLLLGISITFAADREAEKILERVQNAYEKLNEVCADFTQTFFWKLTDETQVVSGSICARGGDKFRIETPEQIVVTDGKVLWTYDKMKNQLIIDNAENANSDNPFIKDFMRKYITEYDAIMQESEDRSLRKILLTSKTGEHFVPRMWIWVDNKTDLIKKIVQEDLNENTTTFQMTDLNKDVSLPASDFKFQTPDNAQVIDMR